MRTTPRPRFHYDELVEEGPRLEALITKAVADDQSSDRTDELAPTAVQAEGGDRGAA